MTLAFFSISWMVLFSGGCAFVFLSLFVFFRSFVGFSFVGSGSGVRSRITALVRSFVRSFDRSVSRCEVGRPYRRGPWACLSEVVCRVRVTRNLRARLLSFTHGVLCRSGARSFFLSALSFARAFLVGGAPSGWLVGWLAGWMACLLSVSLCLSLVPCSFFHEFRPLVRSFVRPLVRSHSVGEAGCERGDGEKVFVRWRAGEVIEGVWRVSVVRSVGRLVGPSVYEDDEDGWIGWVCVVRVDRGA